MTDFDRQLFILAPLSLAILFVGLFHLLAPRARLTVRIGIAGGLIAASMGLSSVLVESWSYAGLAAVLAAGSLSAAFTVRNRPASRARCPLVAGAGISLAGVALLAVTVVFHDSGLEGQLDDEGESFELFRYVPEREPDGDRQLLTDRGRALIPWRAKSPMSRDEIDDKESRTLGKLDPKYHRDRTGPASEVSNCHGWVFTGGRWIITNGDVESILADNGYRTVERPVPGDIAIYRKDGLVTHTALVRSAEPGRTVMVESKWSWMGVFHHGVDQSMYGDNFAYYRTDRPNHVVKIIDRSTQFGGAE